MGGAQFCQRRSSNTGPSVSPNESEEPIPAWSEKNCIEFCKQGQEHLFKGKARLLLDDRPTSLHKNGLIDLVPTVIQSLNSGSLDCLEGFGMVRSLARGLYFLIWRNGMKSIAFEKLGVDEQELNRAAGLRRRPPPQPKEFCITLDRCSGAALGIDVIPKEEENCLVIEAVLPSGCVGIWNRNNPDRYVDAGDRIVEVNGKRGDSQAIIEECQKLQSLEVKIMPAHMEALRKYSAASSNSSGTLSSADDALGASEVLVSIKDVGSASAVSVKDAMCGTAAEELVGPQVDRYEVSLDRTDAALLGVDIVPQYEDGSLTIQDISEGLVQSWNASHPESLVREGDRIVEVNGARGDVNLIIEQCKRRQVLQMKIMRGAKPAATKIGKSWADVARSSNE